MTINEALKEYINQRGFKQQVIAQAVGMKMQSFNSMLNGHCRLSAETLLKACEFMKATPNEIFKVQ